jgi:hypothetical protein
MSHRPLSNTSSLKIAAAYSIHRVKGRVHQPVPNTRTSTLSQILRLLSTHVFNVIFKPLIRTLGKLGKYITRVGVLPVSSGLQLQKEKRTL